MKSRLLFIACVSIACLLSGCVSADKKPADSASGETKKPKEEYVYYYPTGSNIPVRVKKSTLQQAEKEAADDMDKNKEALRNLELRGTTPPRAPGGP